MSDKNKQNPGAVTTASGDNKKESKEAKEAQDSKGLYEVEYLKNHGTSKKGDTAKMHLSTAKALAHHKVVKVGDKITKVKKPKR